MEEILNYFPINIKNVLLNLINNNKHIENNIQEIRVRVDRPIILKIQKNNIAIDYIVNQREMLQIIERICENSIYAYKNQICEGFLTVKGGHRVGITGTVVIDNGNIINIKYISSINFRIARQVLNCSNRILKEIINKENNNIFNSLIVSPPGCGKTTILRDTIRRVSNGIDEMNFTGKTCGVVDERGEIAAMYKGIPQNDLGIRTDVIENVSKSKGMKMLIRSMSPEVIACDEIGSKDDVDAIENAINSGVKGIFTMHGKTLDDVRNNKDVYKIIENKQIEKIIFI